VSDIHQVDTLRAPNTTHGSEEGGEQMRSECLVRDLFKQHSMVQIH